MATISTDPVMLRVRTHFEKSGLSLEQLGSRMGYAKATTARNSAWQFLHRTNDPRISMLRRFAKALEIPLKDLV